MAPLLDPPVIKAPPTNLRCAEPNIIDFRLLKQGTDRAKLLEVIEKAAGTGLLHVINHGLNAKWFRILQGVTYTYMMNTSLKQKDEDTAVKGTGYFEGYKPRTEAEKLNDLTPPIEEYNYDYHATGKVRRPQVIQEHEEVIGNIFDFYHSELTPPLLDLIGEFCKLEPGKLRALHEKSSEVAHLLLYHSGWFRNAAKKRAGYAGHTDIGTLTYLYANPVAGLQVYGPTGWEHVSYVPNSLLVNAGDAMEYVTRGLFNATLHRLIKPTEDQLQYARTALVYFVHPDYKIMKESLQYFKAQRENQTQQSRKSPGGPIDGASLNRVISAISANSEDVYMQVVDADSWATAKMGGLVMSPSNVMFNLHDLTMAMKAT